MWGAANFKRNYHQILTLASQPDLPARRLIVGETFTPSGNWSTYPPHKHQVDDLPREAYHEEMYYFKVNPADGFGICHYYNEEGEEENFTVRDNSIHMMPRGYHTVVSAPGYTTYYLWFLAGNQRVQATVDDPQLGLGQPHRGDVEGAGALKRPEQDISESSLCLRMRSFEIMILNLQTGWQSGAGYRRGSGPGAGHGDRVGRSRRRHRRPGSRSRAMQPVKRSPALGRRFTRSVCDLRTASVDRSAAGRGARS